MAYAPGLTPTAVLEKLGTIQLIDVCIPTCDGRWLILPRYTQPDDDLKLLLHHLAELGALVQVDYATGRSGLGSVSLKQLALRSRSLTKGIDETDEDGERKNMTKGVTFHTRDLRILGL